MTQHLVKLLLLQLRQPLSRKACSLIQPVSHPKGIGIVPDVAFSDLAEDVAYFGENAQVALRLELAFENSHRPFQPATSDGSPCLRVHFQLQIVGLGNPFNQIATIPVHLHVIAFFLFAGENELDAFVPTACYIDIVASDHSLQEFFHVGSHYRLPFCLKAVLVFSAHPYDLCLYLF